MKQFRILLASIGAVALVGMASALPADQEKRGDKPPTPVEDPKPEAPKAVIGKAAPDFELKSLDGKTVKLSDHKGKIVVLEWFDPTCPACNWAYGEKGPLATLPGRLKEQGVVWLAVNSAGADFKGSDQKKNEDFVEKYKMKSPILFDTKGEVGRTYGAKTTPHMYVIDAKGVLAYQGALDNAPMGKLDDEKHIAYVEEAVKALKEGKKIETTETRSYG